MTAEARGKLLRLCDAFDDLAEALQGHCGSHRIAETVQELRKSVEAIRQLLSET